MSAKVIPLIPEQFGRRMAYRFSLTLPVYLELAGQKFSARLVNLARSGALIETTATFATESAMIFQCGTVTAAATVVWVEANRCGLTFLRPLTTREIHEQLSRSIALGSRPSKLYG